MFWRKTNRRIGDEQRQMRRVSCVHCPDDALKGESKVVERKDYEPMFGISFNFRELVTNRVCRNCNVHYVTRHRIDEISANVGPVVKSGPEKPA